jgi:hypothetical protein
VGLHSIPHIRRESIVQQFCSEEEGIPTRSDLFRNAAKNALMYLLDNPSPEPLLAVTVVLSTRSAKSNSQSA